MQLVPPADPKHPAYLGPRALAFAVQLVPSACPASFHRSVCSEPAACPEHPAYLGPPKSAFAVRLREEDGRANALARLCL